METRTEYLSDNSIMDMLKARESDGWAVRQIVIDCWDNFENRSDGGTGRTATRYFVVFERERTEP